MSGLKKFLLRGNIVDLAVAVVIGVAFNAVVQALVKDLITPLIAAAGKQPDFAGLSFTLNKSVFGYGDFINTVVSFAVIATVVYYLVVVPAARFAAASAKQQEVTTHPCPECLSDIPLLARRCRFCTAAVEPVPAAPAPAAPAPAAPAPVRRRSTWRPRSS